MSDDKQPGQDAPEKKNPLQPMEPIRTQHALAFGNQTLNYEATVGKMPFEDEGGELLAQMFYTAYTVESDQPRPLTFVFNGGPGSSSIWLHMGALGPKRVRMNDDGSLPAPPYTLEGNAHSWLPWTDLVFIDPIGTGFSRAKDAETAKKYYGLEPDLDSVGEFIRKYISQHNRWNAPLYLAGESYGTFRAAGIAGKLVDQGIAFNGVLLISTILNYLTGTFMPMNDLPYMLFLPTYAATAHYHGRVAEAHREKPLREFLKEVEEFVTKTYSVALMQGDLLPDDERTQLAQQLADYTGMSVEYIDRANLRIEHLRFCKELLRDEKWTVGRLDSRLQGIDALHVDSLPEHDPSYTAIMTPYTMLFNQYVREELGYETTDKYETLSFEVNQQWTFSEKGRSMPDTSEHLRKALAKNPHMRAFVGLGYYDLATPYFAAQYTMNHMNIRPALHANITYADYEAGHMMYIHRESLEKLARDVEVFYATLDES